MPTASTDYIQLHGNESPGYCRPLRSSGLHLIKAFSISQSKDLATALDYKGLCDYYLLMPNITVWRLRQPVRLEPAAPLQRNDAFSAQRRNQPLQR